MCDDEVNVCKYYIEHIYNNHFTYFVIEPPKLTVPNGRLK